MIELRRRPRVVFVGAFGDVPGAPPGGQQTACRTLAGSQFAEQCELWKVDTVQISYPPPGLWRRGVRAAGRSLKTLRLLAKRPEAALFFAGTPAGLLEKSVLAGVGRALGVRTGLALRSSIPQEDARRSRWLRRYWSGVFRLPGLILCQSTTWEERLISDLGVRPERVAVLWSWVDPRALEVTLRPRAGGPLRVLYVGRLAPEKGLRELLEAVAGCAGAVEVDLVGDGSEGFRAELGKSPAARAGWVRFHGFLEGSAKWERFEAADALALPTYAEGFPNVVLEGMAAQLPVVVSAVGAIPSVVRDHVHGLLIAPRDAESLRAALQRLVDQPELGPALGRAGRQEVLRRHTVDFGVKTILRALRLGGALTA